MKKQGCLQLLSIQTGGALCLPVIMLGQLVCQEHGWFASILVIGIGNLFLLLCALGVAFLSAERPKSTVEQAVDYFGSKGRAAVAIIIMISMMGWFAVQLNMMSLSLAQIFSFLGVSVNVLLLSVVLGAILSVVMCLGMRAVSCLANISTPLLVLTLFYALFSVEGKMGEASPLSISWIGGLSFVIGGGISSVIDLPNFLQHAKSRKHSCLAIIGLYGFAVPFIEGVGVYLTAKTGGASILEVLQQGHGVLWILWICCFVLLCGWTTNNANLYSATISSYALFKKMNFNKRALILGGVGTLVASCNPLENFGLLLELLGIIIGSMGAVILMSYLLEHFQQKITKKSSFFSWFLGMGIGLFPLFLGVSLTGVAVLDSFVGAACMQGIATILNKKEKIYETTNS